MQSWFHLMDAVIFLPPAKMDGTVVTLLMLPKQKRVMQKLGTDSWGHVVFLLLSQLASTTCWPAARATSISRYGERWMKSGRRLLEEPSKTGSSAHHDQPGTRLWDSQTENDNLRKLQYFLNLQTFFHSLFKQDSTAQANGLDGSYNRMALLYHMVNAEFICKLWVGLWYVATVLHIHKQATC